jgi:hypothetical protein
MYDFYDVMWQWNLDVCGIAIIDVCGIVFRFHHRQIDWNPDKDKGQEKRDGLEPKKISSDATSLEFFFSFRFLPPSKNLFFKAPHPLPTLALLIRVTRWFWKKIAQNVDQLLFCQNYYKKFKCRQKLPKYFGLICNFSDFSR